MYFGLDTLWFWVIYIYHAGARKKKTTLKMIGGGAFFRYGCDFFSFFVGTLVVGTLVIGTAIVCTSVSRSLCSYINCMYISCRYNDHLLKFC